VVSTCSETIRSSKIDITDPVAAPQDHALRRTLHQHPRIADPGVLRALFILPRVRHLVPADELKLMLHTGGLRFDYLLNLAKRTIIVTSITGGRDAVG